MDKYVKKHDEKMSVLEYLSNFYQILKKNKLYACLRKLKCVCEDKNNCHCDDDTYHIVTEVKMITVDKDTAELNLKIKGDFDLVKKDFMLKIFTYDDNDNEVQIFNVDHNKLKLYIDCMPVNIKFYIKEKILCSNQVIKIVFDYQSYKKCD